MLEGYSQQGKVIASFLQKKYIRQVIHTL